MSSSEILHLFKTLTIRRVFQEIRGSYVTYLCVKCHIYVDWLL